MDEENKRIFKAGHLSKLNENWLRIVRLCKEDPYFNELYQKKRKSIKNPLTEEEQAYYDEKLSAIL
jgi:hypothetical protein